MKKWDWLRAETAETLENQRSRRCLSQFFHSLGPWEVGKTDWHSPIEPSSTAKAEAYADGYRRTVLAQPALCLGSYAFLWGHKQETTATWFGMLLPDGSRLAAVDAMTAVWTGSPPRNSCPRIESLVLDRSGRLRPGEVVGATLAASDPLRRELTVKWILRSDSVTIGVGGDAQAEESAFADAVSPDGMSAQVVMPEGGGGYRLFAYVYDGQGGAAVANVPLYVDAPIKPIPAPKASLPFVVYGDGMKDSPYVPSGYMGNTEAITMTLDSTDSPHAGKTCLKIEYRASDQWGGVLWQSPENDWDGVRPGGLNLNGAVACEFWARGEAVKKWDWLRADTAKTLEKQRSRRCLSQFFHSLGAEGGETVNFMLGLLDGNQPYRDTAKGELKEVRLTNQWQKLRITLPGRDLSRIKTAFGWSLAGQGKPLTFYLDDIRYIAE